MLKSTNFKSKILIIRKVSEMLEDEAKKMEEKLEMVKKMMELEKEKRT